MILRAVLRGGHVSGRPHAGLGQPLRVVPAHLPAAERGDAAVRGDGQPGAVEHGRDPPPGGGIEVQRDHRALIEKTLAVLEPGGVLWFSTNHQRFDPRLDGLDFVEMTQRTVPEDYRNRTAHRSFRIVKG